MHPGCSGLVSRERPPLGWLPLVLSGTLGNGRVSDSSTGYHMSLVKNHRCRGRTSFGVRRSMIFG